MKTLVISLKEVSAPEELEKEKQNAGSFIIFSSHVNATQKIASRLKTYENEEIDFLIISKK